MEGSGFGGSRSVGEAGEGDLLDGLLVETLDHFCERQACEVKNISLSHQEQAVLAG